MGKLNSFLKRKGINISSPKGFAYFIKRCFQFLGKYGLRSFSIACNKLNNNENHGEENNSKVGTGKMTYSYEGLLKKITPRQNELAKLKLAIPNLLIQPKFSIAINVTSGGLELDDLLFDIDKQIYAECNVFLFRNKFTAKSEAIGKKMKSDEFSTRINDFTVCDNLSEVYKNVNGDYVIFLREGDRLSKNSLFEFVLEMNRIKERPIAMYCDHDIVVNGGYTEPFNKPGWSPDLFLVNNYINRAFAISLTAIKEITPNFNLSTYANFCYDMLLKVSEKHDIKRVANVLIHLTSNIHDSDFSEEQNQIRTETLKRRNINGVVSENKYYNTMISRQVVGNPKVSIIIPTCYTEDYIEKCLESIEKKTTYKNYEIIVIDNSRKSPRIGQKRLNNYKCNILYINEPFNWARLNNLAVKKATGEFLMFLNDDIEIISEDWIQKLLAEAQRPDIAVVGPMLLFPNGTVQSAGVFLVNHGGGGRSFYLNQPEDCTEYHDFLHYQRECSLIIGACMMLERNKFDSINGFDESFALVGNEMDLCLRLREAGYRNLYQPDVKLYHKEKASRSGMDETAGDEYIWSIWNRKLELCDEYFNPNLNVYSNVPMDDTDPVRCMLVGSPTLAPVNIKKIIVVKLDHIGDDIIALAAIRKIRSIYPDAQIDLLCGPWAKGMMEAQPEIDDVITYEYFSVRSQLGVTGSNPKLVAKLIKQLKLNHYDLSIHLRRHEETQGIAAEIADYCLAYSMHPIEDSISHSVSMLTDLSFQRPKWSMHDQLLSLVRNLEYEPELDRELTIPLEVVKRAKEFADSVPQFKANLRIGIHAGAGGDFKQWNPDYFARLCNLIHAMTNAEIILFGGKDEIEINKRILCNVRDKKRIVDIAGQQSLLEYCALVKHVDYFIGNDSGPKHIAGIQGVPTITINGSTSEQEWSSPGLKIMSVRKMIGCCPCYYYLPGHCPEHKCMTMLGPGAVYSGLERLMLLYPHNARKE